MKKFIKNIPILMVRIILIGIYTSIYVIPLHILLYVLIFIDTNLMSEISFKCFLVAYFTSFVILYKKTMKSNKNAENQ